MSQVPRFETDKLLVEEGGILSISISQLSASDADTVSSELVFMVDALPRFGTLQKEGRTLRKGTKFSLDDLRKKSIRYLLLPRLVGLVDKAPRHIHHAWPVTFSF